MVIDLVGNSQHPSKEAVGTEVVAPLWKTHGNDRPSQPAPHPTSSKTVTNLPKRK